MRPATWEELYSDGQRLRAENDALKLRVAVLEKAHAQVTAERDEALKRIYRLENERDSGHWCENERAAKHAANNRCQAVAGVCERAIAHLASRAAKTSDLLDALETALKSSDTEDPAMKERAAIVRKIRQDAQISAALVRIGGRAGLDKALNGLADEIEQGVREQVCDGQG